MMISFPVSWTSIMGGTSESKRRIHSETASINACFSLCTSLIRPASCDSGDPAFGKK